MRPAITLQWLGTVDRGKQLEISAEIAGTHRTVAVILADDADESQWLQISVGDQPIELPVAALRKALELAADEVRSESWYERNVYAQLQDSAAEACRQVILCRPLESLAPLALERRGFANSDGGAGVTYPGDLGGQDRQGGGVHIPEGQVLVHFGAGQREEVRILVKEREYLAVLDAALAAKGLEPQATAVRALLQSLP